MQTISMQELQNTAEVQRLCAETEGPVFVTENGAERLVVMNPDYYKQYEQALWQMYEATLIQEGLEDLRAGRMVDGPAALAEIRRNYGV